MNAEHYRARASVLIAGLRERFLELEARDFPAPTPGEVIEHLCRILTLVESKLSGGDERTCRLVIKLVFEYQKLLSIFDNAHSEQTPRGLVRVLEDLLIFRRIHDGPCKLIAAPQTTYNYTIVDLTVQIYRSVTHLFTKEDLAAIQLKEPIFLIAFPRIERDSTLLHPVFGHEVGHLIAFRFLEEASRKKEFGNEFNRAFEPIAKAIRQQHKNDQVALVTELQRQGEMLRTYWQRGLEELISDYVGLLLFGPSALFASFTIFSQQELDRPPQGPFYYPPSRYRLRFSLEVLQDDGYMSAMTELVKAPGEINAFPAVTEWLEHMRSLTKERTDVTALEKDPTRSAAYEWIRSSLSEAKKYARERIKAILYTSELMKREVPELVERISLDLPPNEIGTFATLKPASWGSAFNASWFYIINGKTREGEPLGLKDQQKVNQLALRAVEGILLKERYQAE
ncbi:MAG TPA: hypothetical protein VNM24_06975 [Burkholderiales bacterium]|nr:hypothetical protein [Burkholderiales bacterium]